jgi:hypothetical protein
VVHSEDSNDKLMVKKSLNCHCEETDYTGFKITIIDDQLVNEKFLKIGKSCHRDIVIKHLVECKKTRCIHKDIIANRIDEIMAIFVDNYKISLFV